MKGLVSTKDAEIRRRIQNKLEKEPNITLQKIAEDCQMYLSVKQDSKKKIEESGIAHIRKICYQKKQSLSLKLIKQRKSRIICPLTHVPDVGPYTCTKTVLSGTKSVSYDTKVRNADLKNKTNSYIKNTKSDGLDGVYMRKFVDIKMLNKSAKFQLDSSSDLTLIKLQTWKGLGKLTMIKSNNLR